MNVTTQNVRLPARYQKVLNICPALNNTFVFFGIRGFREDCLTHFDAEGKLIDEIIFEHNMDSFGMLSDREVLVLETRKGCISLWNLETHKFHHIPFKFLNEEVDQSAIYIFPDTRMFCVQENGRYNDDSFRLSYFRQ